MKTQTRWLPEEEQMQMGFGMEGIEEQILDATKYVAHCFDEVTYVEIGVGEGATLSAVAATLKESGKKWRAIGVELPNGYSFNRQKTIDWARERELPLDFKTPNGTVVHPPWNAITVYFQDSQSFLTELWQDPIHFALIDGCHGKPCATLDFLAIEAFAPDEAMVMFHDFGQDQKGHYQPHCVTGLDVYGACYDLGLLTERRPGWRFIGVWNGDRLRGGWDMGVFRKKPK